MSETKEQYNEYLTKEEYDRRANGSSHLKHVIMPLLNSIKKPEFCVGDVLNKYYFEGVGDNKEKIYSYSDRNLKTKRLYRVVCVDEFGLTFIKSIKFDGKLHGRTICISVVGKFKYELDPQYSDHLILGENFNAEDLVKEQGTIKKANAEYNKSIEVKWPLKHTAQGKTAVYRYFHKKMGQTFYLKLHSSSRITVAVLNSYSSGELFFRPVSGAEHLWVDSSGLFSIKTNFFYDSGYVVLYSSKPRGIDETP